MCCCCGHHPCIILCLFFQIAFRIKEYDPVTGLPRPEGEWTGKGTYVDPEMHGWEARLLLFNAAQHDVESPRSIFFGLPQELMGLRSIMKVRP